MASLDTGLGALMLVADADEATAHAIARRLRRDGFLVFATTRGREALRVAHVSHLRAAIVATILEDMTGAELLRRLRALDGGVPFVVTGRADARVEREIRASGVAHFASRPADTKRVCRVVEQVLGVWGRDSGRAAGSKRNVKPKRRNPSHD
jgi:DNA-binding response OmpR family regulator